MEKLLGKSPDELKAIVKELGMPSFTAGQIVDWLYKKDIRSVQEMTNLSAQNRNRLAESYEIGVYEFTKVQESIDGTKKYLFPAAGQKFVEAAFIPDKDRKTLCVSTQIGCKMGCLFCMTAKQGFQGNLTAGEIINQIRSIPEGRELSNIVYMGMGEPLDNLKEVMRSLEILTAEWGYAMSPKRITVSTIGIIPGMKEFLNQSDAHLAVSLHSPFDEERRQLMPVQHVYPIREVLEEIRSWDFGRQRRVSFEYIVFKNLNDTPAHVKELSRILNGIKCRINLIRFHAIPGAPFETSDESRLEIFKNELNKKGLLTTIRKSRGEDIYAACGLLSTKELVKQQNPDF
jgi:23S rRNA (adenine2503-C2)-methyltransferase